MDTLQIVLFIGVIAMALINAASLVWAFYLENRLRQRPAPKNYDVHLEGQKVFSEIKLDDIQQQAKKALQESITSSMSNLQKSVDAAISQASPRIETMIESTLSQEFTKYDVTLQELREQTIKNFSSLQKDLEGRRQELSEQLDRKIVEEYKHRMELFNTRLSDVVSSYLVETLGNNVDLGTQTNYILQSLDKHKEDIKRDVLE